MERIILASASPRRKELLKMLTGDRFQVFTSSYDEGTAQKSDPAELVTRNSLGKAREVARHFNDGVIISADTVVLCREEILGKPDNAAMAKGMLRKVSGQQVQAITGITVLDVSRNREITRHEITNLWIKQLSEEDVESYVNSGEPFGKAGAFAVQGKGALFVERIEGDFFNAVGLPLFRLGRMLKEMGIQL
ncbi:Maf family nucleotide pyrophosphatase [Methanolobus halotolerans]|uniref:dTTP/UTP pyrophosphatase n=1 Tax=Methanolobus halotolerans TaxID=2052935 RepID=A0A4E0QA12_9EURY|nr:Maf family nucleotide pyrophosphatase [Methanolobus halotolerans]TGC09142.1 septum formation protein Maf [Methanolobus halotolerans]